MADGIKPDKEKLTVKRIRPAYQQVADRIREAILNGQIAPGEQLPVEIEAGNGTEPAQLMADHLDHLGGVYASIDRAAGSST